MASTENPRIFRPERRVMSAVITAELLTERLTPILRRAYGDAKHGVKRLARAASVSPRTAENWLSGANAPRLAEAIRLMAECDDIASEINALIAEQRNARA